MWPPKLQILINKIVHYFTVNTCALIKIVIEMGHNNNSSIGKSLVLMPFCQGHNLCYDIKNTNKSTSVFIYQLSVSENTIIIRNISIYFKNILLLMYIIAVPKPKKKKKKKIITRAFNSFIL